MCALQNFWCSNTHFLIGIIHPRRETLSPSPELKNCRDKKAQPVLHANPSSPIKWRQKRSWKLSLNLHYQISRNLSHEQHSLVQHWCEWGKTHSHPWRLSPAQQQAPAVIHEPTKALTMALWVQMSFYLQREIKYICVPFAYQFMWVRSWEELGMAPEKSHLCDTLMLGHTV